MCRLRHNKIQAARDVFYMAELLKVEENISKGRSLLKDLFVIPRNRRAMLASEIVMFMVCSLALSWNQLTVSATILRRQCHWFVSTLRPNEADWSQRTTVHLYL
jgi:hypothetical protein